MTRDSTGVIIIWENKILLFHRDNISTIPNPDCWTLTGGHIETGETPLQGIKRELQEEVSHAPKDLSFFVKITGKENNNYIYCAFVNNDEAKLFKHGVGEGQEVGFFTIDEALKLKLTQILEHYLTKFRYEIEESMKNKILPKVTI